MKFRKDFVTNSSSSSYVCDICGASEEGYDLCLSEAGMMQCVNGHTFCEDEALELPQQEDLVKYILENEYNYNNEAEEDLMKMDSDELFEKFASDGGNYEVPEFMCPICNFIEYSNYDLEKYLKKKYNVPEDEVFAEIKKMNKRRKRLYTNEYNTYVCKLHDLNPAEIVTGWKEEFDSYEKFKEYIRS